KPRLRYSKRHCRHHKERHHSRRDGHLAALCSSRTIQCFSSQTGRVLPPLRRIICFTLFLSHPSFHHLILEQAAFECAVEKRRTLRGGEVDQLGQTHVGAEQ